MEQAPGQKRRSTLYFFIEENHNLFSVMGVFAALALFSQTYLGSLPGIFISFLLVTCFVILMLELWNRFEKRTSADELLYWFQKCLLLIGVAVIAYWSLGLRLVDKGLFYQALSLGLAAILISAATRIARERGYPETSWWKWLSKYKILLPILFLLAGLVTYGIWVGVHNYLAQIMEPMFVFLWEAKTAVLSSK